jgi:hypothetical protein
MVDIKEMGEPANISWVMQSLVYLFGNPISNIALPSSFPGAVNPMLWWTTPNMQVSDPADLEAGL